MKILSASHVDHSLTITQIAYLAQRFASRQAFFVETFELPPELGTVPCELHGPVVGGAAVPEAEVHYERRGDRSGSSRLCRRAPQATRLVTVVAGPDGDEPCVLYTAYGGPPAPREPWDTSLNEAVRAESQAFWALHALSAEQS